MATPSMDRVVRRQLLEQDDVEALREGLRVVLAQAGMETEVSQQIEWTHSHGEAIEIMTNGTALVLHRDVS